MIAFLGGPLIGIAFGLIFAIEVADGSIVAALPIGIAVWAGFVAFVWFGSRGQMDFRMKATGGALTIGEGNRELTMATHEVVLIESSRHATRLNAVLEQINPNAVKSKIGFVRVTSQLGARKVTLPPEQVDAAAYELAELCPKAMWVDSNEEQHLPAVGGAATGLEALSRKRRSQAMSLLAAGGGMVLFGIFLATGIFTSGHAVTVHVFTTIPFVLGFGLSLWGVRHWRQASEFLSRSRDASHADS